ncbi:MAG: DUF1800 domain-containing protein [Gemmatimonadota bacterium]|nr:DUF1800 domain-containing protein [Gemmatimonadota bacterium]MDQ6871850.1 DUF1800 domain-containing protein [Gemmatimonadota bacterium]
MRITKLSGIAAALLSLAPINSSAQGAKPKKIAIARSDVRELPADQQIIQALSRLTFGPRPGDALKVRAIGLDAWIDQQLRPDRIDDSALESFVANYSVIHQDQNGLLQQYAKQQRERQLVRRDRADSTRVMTAADSMAMRQQLQQLNLTRQVVTQLQSSRVARAVASERQLQEVMTDFWENHFNIYAQKGGPEPYYLADFDENVIRPHALGKFRDLLEEVSKSPAMLFYLDNARSMADSTRPTLNPQNGVGGIRVTPMRRGGVGVTVGAIRAAQQMQRQQQPQRQRQGLNENYGRELLELHTLGVDGGYTQQDVINVARAFTGWTIRPPAQGGGFVFGPQVHDAGEKIVLGHKLAAGRGMEDAEDVLDILAKSPATARFISFKLARRFVSDSPSKALVDHAAQVYLRTDGDIREVLRAIITSPEFFSQQAFHSKVKTPFEVVVSAMRALNAAPDSTPRSAQVIAFLGQPIFGHQAPNGWPETGDAWMNTGAILNRINFGMSAAAGRLPGVDIRALPVLDTLRSATREKQVDAVVATILNGMVSPDTRAVLMSGEHPLVAKGTSAGVMLSAAPRQTTSDTGAMPAQEMSSAGDGARARPNQNAGGRRAAVQGRGFASVPQLTGLPQIVGLALGSPEFQRH